MIIAQDIQLSDRRSLFMLKKAARQQRNERKERLQRGAELFTQKWNAEYIGERFAQNYIPKLLSNAVESVVDTPSSDSKGQEESKNGSSLKTIALQTIERLFPLIIRKVWA